LVIFGKECFLGIVEKCVNFIRPGSGKPERKSIASNGGDEREANDVAAIRGGEEVSN
jgi:hypothetical protein